MKKDWQFKFVLTDEQMKVLAPFFKIARIAAKRGEPGAIFMQAWEEPQCIKGRFVSEETAMNLRMILENSSTATSDEQGEG